MRLGSTIARLIKRGSAHRLCDPERGRLTERPENLVRVGKKPVMNYVVACVTLFNSGKEEIVLRARGQSINNAVDIVERLKKFQKNLDVRDINIGSEDVTRPDGTRANISTIEIALRKAQPSAD